MIALFSRSQKTVSITLLVEGTILFFSLRCVMTFHALAFSFWVEMVESGFITSHNVKQDVITLSNMMLKQL